MSIIKQLFLCMNFLSKLWLPHSFRKGEKCLKITTSQNDKTVSDSMGVSKLSKRRR